MATSNFFIAPEDGWVVVATDPGFLRISAQIPHRWSYTIAASLPADSVVGLLVDEGKVLVINEPFTGNVYARVNGITAGCANGKLRLDVTALTVTSGGGAGDASAANQTTQITAANLTNTNLGGVTEAAPATDTASSGLNGRLQRIAQRLTTVNTTLGTPFQAGGSIGNTTFASTQSGTWNITNISGTISLPTGAATETTLAAMSLKLPASLGAKTGATSLSVVPNTDTAFPVAGSIAAGVADSGNGVKVSGKANSGGLTPVSSNQRQDVWLGIIGQIMTGLGINASIAAISAGSAATVMPFAGGSTSAGPLASLPYLWNSTTGLAPTAGDTNGTVTQPFAVAASRWAYPAASGGILNTTTAVTIANAGGVGVRNYLTGLQISWEVLTNATEIAVRDGASGTVLWRDKIPSGAAGRMAVTFSNPKRGTANTLLEFVTLTASGVGAVYVNADGYTGT